MDEQDEVMGEQAVRNVLPSHSAETIMPSVKDLPLGYKRTTLGVIPEDWETKRLGDIADLHRRGITPTMFPDEPFQHFSLPAYDENQAPRVEQGNTIGSNKFKVPANVVLVSKLNPRIPRVWKPESIGINAVASTEFLLFTPREGVSRNFLYVLCCSPEFNEQMKLLVTGTTGSHQRTSPAGALKIEIKVPLSRKEQRAIATILTDADALIESLDRLIAKKRAIKQATMQQLLTGQTRLPGFTGEWETTTLSNLVRHHSGNSSLIKGRLSSEPRTGLYPGFSASGKDVWCSRYDYEGDAVVVSAVGSRCGKAFLATGKWNAIANTHVVWPIACKVDWRFLALFINREDFWVKSGSGQPFVLFKQTFSRPLFFPPFNEQTAIATILTDMDSEIEALEHRRDKVRQVKQGMMQQLLTGQVRLVEPGVAV